jgi:hypothetical protein
MKIQKKKCKTRTGLEAIVGVEGIRIISKGPVK